MYIYIIMLLLSLLFAFFIKKSNNKLIKILFLILTILPFAIVSGLRYDVGTDFIARYTNDFYVIANGGVVSNMEIGFVLIIKFCLLFSKNSQLLFILTSILISYFIITGIEKNSKNILLSITLYGICGFFFKSMNIIRQFLAMAMIFWGYRFLLKKGQTKYYFLTCLLAFFIHSSSIVMIVLPLLKKKVYMHPLIALGISLFIIFFKDFCWDVLTVILQNTRFAVYLKGRYTVGNISWLYFIIYFIIYVGAFILLSIKKKNNANDIDGQDYLLLNIATLTFLFESMTSYHILLSRIAMYFSLFQIISIPYFIETTKFNLNVKKNAIAKKTLCAGVIIFFLIVTYYTNIIHNDAKPLPYQSVIKF